MHYFQFNIGDYASHTRHLNLYEDLAYRRLLDAYYLREKPLPKEVELVARLISMNDRLTDVERVLNEFFEATKAGWINKRADEEIFRFHKKLATASKAGKASVESKRQRSLNGTSTDVQPTINQEPRTINQEPVKKSMQRGTRLPADFELPDDWVFFCKQERPELVPREVFAGFKDYWISQAGVKATKTDWFATWRNWVRNQKVTRMAPALSVTQKNKQEHYSKMFGRSDDERTIEAITPRLG
jgi:uncharacterized protein YdaU (DUF1376 family)